MPRGNKHAPLCLALLLLAAGACATLPRFQPVDITAPGWVARTAQAVWRPDSGKPEITGELIVATNQAGGLFVQFSKNPFNIVTAQRGAGNWQLEYGPEGKRYSGEGNGPARIIWLRLPEILLGGRAPLGWTLHERSAGELKLEHSSRGERLDIFFQ